MANHVTVGTLLGNGDHILHLDWEEDGNIVPWEEDVEVVLPQVDFYTFVWGLEASAEGICLPLDSKDCILVVVEVFLDSYWDMKPSICFMLELVGLVEELVVVDSHILHNILGIVVVAVVAEVDVVVEFVVVFPFEGVVDLAFLRNLQANLINHWLDLHCFFLTSCHLHQQVWVKSCQIQNAFQFDQLYMVNYLMYQLKWAWAVFEARAEEQVNLFHHFPTLLHKSFWVLHIQVYQAVQLQALYILDRSHRLGVLIQARKELLQKILNFSFGYLETVYKYPQLNIFSKGTVQQQQVFNY